MYIKRTLEKIIREASKDFRVILLTGPRQVGKTTLLSQIDSQKRSYISFDDLNYRVAAEQDPASFIERLQLPVLLDEVQYVPSLFPYIKIRVDQLAKPGLFWLTGSQQFEMMRLISESLAGRVAIFKLQGISLSEEQGRSQVEPFLPLPDIIKNRQKDSKKLGILEVYHKIWRGAYPDIVIRHERHWERFYESYVSAYIQKDIRDYLNIHDQAIFYKFMQVLAARTGQLLNYREVARDIAVSEPTIKAWVSALEASGIVYLLPPYFNHRTKRLIKTPKLYFLDTGLCCFLSAWLTPEVLERGAMSGALLETYVVSEILKSYLHNGRTPRLYFYRDKEKREIDLLMEENGVLYPIEIKKTASLKNLNLKNFDYLSKLKMPIGHGAVLCFVNDLIPIHKKIEAVPISYI
jgi:uncharacterized protein